MKGKASIKTISELTGFSSATVSNALRNKRGVSRETVEIILKAARETGYLSESRVESIRLVIYKAGGEVVNDSPFFASLIAGVEEESRNSGYETVFYNLRREDPEYEERLEELLNDPSSALLILATELSPEEAKAFLKARSPVVMLDNWYEELPFNAVLIDNTDAALKAVSYLASMGHREIGYLQSSYPIKNFYYRSEGYRRALHENGLSCSPEQIFRLRPSMEGACEDMAAALLKKPKLPTAFFADNDIIALGAVRALQQAGFRVPEDVSVVGFDDLPFCAISDPPLTTIRVYNRQMGCAAVRRLLELMRKDEGEAYKAKIQICSSFVERGSVLDRRTLQKSEAAPENPE